MRVVFRVIFSLFLGIIFFVSCSPRSYLSGNQNGYKNFYGGNFSSPSALESRTTSPSSVSAPSTHSLEDEDIEFIAPALPASTFDVSKIEDIATKETQYLNFTTYNPFMDLGTDTFYIDFSIAGDNFLFPINGELSSQYGMRNGRPHQGVDLRAPKGTSIHSIFDGVVRLSRNYAGYGNVIVIRHYNGLESVYSHNDRNLVNVGDKVSSGDKIAQCGSTGQATGNHLHFEIRVSGVPINPNLVIDVQNKTIQSGVLKITKQGDSVSAVLQGSVHDSAQNQNSQEEEIEITQTPSAPVVAANESRGMIVGGKVVELPPDPPKYHTIKSGETLSHLAVKYNTTIAEICKLNDMTSNAVIKSGQKIRVK